MGNKEIQNVYIFSAKRTPIGSFQGGLSSLAAPQLGAIAIRSALQDINLPEDAVETCIMGQVLTAGSGQAPARQAAIYAGLKNSTTALTINKVCGSGLKSVVLASQMLSLGEADCAVAGGQESMSQAPHLLLQSRTGYRMGSTEVKDSMILDGLFDPYKNFHMGEAAELCAEKFQFTRQAQDEFALASYKKAQHAQSQSFFNREITPVELESKKGKTILAQDEEPTQAKFDKMPGLKPAFKKEGTITAANASKINDGAAALVLGNESFLQKNKHLKPLAKIVAHAEYAGAPEWFTTAPVQAIKKCLNKAGLNPSQIDLWEINEAFSNVTMAAIKELELQADQVNIQGGAVALGHPIGASGARILCTLVHSLLRTNKKRGIASLCIGGGEGIALLIESLP